MTWQIQEAKERFSELINRTLKDGPQTITRHGEPVAVIVAAEEYRRMRSRRRSLKALLARAPLQGVEIRRSRDSGRTLF